MNRITTTALTLAATLVLVGCADSSAPSGSASGQGDGAASAGSASAHAWLLTAAPEGDVSVSEAKANASEGDRIVVRGRIGGRHAPISAESPVFTIMDLSIPHCAQMDDDDHCLTPWDYCCETPETITANAATVQVQADAVDLIGAGLEPLDEVILMGTVGPRPDEKVLTILATGVYPVRD